MSKEYLFIGGPKDGERICTDGSYPILISPEQSGPIKGCGSHSSSDDYLYNLHRVSHGNDYVEFYVLGSICYVDAIQMLIDNYHPPREISCEVKIDWAKEPERMAEHNELLKKTQDAVCNAYGIDASMLPTSKIFIGGTEINSASIDELLDVLQKIRVGNAMSHASIGCDHVSRIDVIGDETLDALKKLNGQKFECKSEDYFIPSYSKKIDWTQKSECTGKKINFVEITHDDLASPGDFFNKAYKPTTRNLMLVFQDEEQLDWAKNIHDTFYDASSGLFFGCARWCLKGEEVIIYPEGL